MALSRELVSRQHGRRNGGQPGCKVGLDVQHRLEERLETTVVNRHFRSSNDLRGEGEFRVELGAVFLVVRLVEGLAVDLCVKERLIEKVFDCRLRQPKLRDRNDIKVRVKVIKRISPCDGPAQYLAHFLEQVDCALVAISDDDHGRLRRTLEPFRPVRILRYKIFELAVSTGQILHFASVRRVFEESRPDLDFAVNGLKEIRKFGMEGADSAPKVYAVRLTFADDDGLFDRPKCVVIEEACEDLPVSRNTFRLFKIGFAER